MLKPDQRIKLDRREGTEWSRVELVKQYFAEVSGFSAPEVVVNSNFVDTRLQLEISLLV